MGNNLLDTDADVDVSFEDQRSINMFSINNSKLLELKASLQQKQKVMQELGDLEVALMLKEDPVAIRICEVFCTMTSEESLEYISKEKEKVEYEIAQIKDRLDNLEKCLTDLKVKLYNKFSNSINLEVTDST